MTFRITSLIAASALCTGTAALAQHDHRADTPVAGPATSANGEWKGNWDGAWSDADTWRGTWHGTYTGLDGVPIQAEYRGTFIGESRFLSEDGHALSRQGEHEWREDHGPMGPVRHMEGPRFAYSPEQRADWLDECHANFDRLNDEDQFDGRRHGARVGGLLGAIGGGIAGNRIAGRGNRVVETAIGAGVGAGAGALAGAAIGSAADADSDRRGPPHGDYCEDYLSRYESGAANYGQGGGYGYGPVMWVRVPIIRERSHDCDCEEVIEEVVYTPHHARRVTPRRAVVRKYVRYAK